MAESKTLRRSRPEDKSNQHKSSRETAALSVSMVVLRGASPLTSLIECGEIQPAGQSSCTPLNRGPHS